MEPNEPGAGFEFINKIVGGVVPKEYIPAVEAGIKEAMESGVLAGYPVVDVKVTLFDGSYHEVDSSEMAFKIAASIGFKEAARKANPVLLEPIMKVEVVTPEDFMGDVVGDLNARRGPDRGDGARGATPRWSGPWCPRRRCSATPPTCVRRPRGGQCTRCTSRTTKKCRRTSLKSSSRAMRSARHHH